MQSVGYSETSFCRLFFLNLDFRRADGLAMLNHSSSHGCEPATTFTRWLHDQRWHSPRSGSSGGSACGGESCAWAALDHGAACVRAFERGRTPSPCHLRCCAPPAAASAAAPARHAVVFQVSYVVSDDLLARLSRAASQIRDGGGDDRLYVAYVIGDGDHDRCPDGGAATSNSSRSDLAAEPGGGGGSATAANDGVQNLHRLKAAVGAHATVWCLDPTSYAELWPGFFAYIRGLEQRRARKAYIKRSAVDGINWAWIGCDLHAQAGVGLRLLPAWLRAAHAASARPPAAAASCDAPRVPPPRPLFDFLWAIDWDISWVGHLPRLLHAFDGDGADLLTTDPATQHLDNRSGYHAHGLRNHLRDDQVWKALLAPARYSRRMLAWLHETVAAGHHSFCETRGPSACALQQPACRQASLRATRPELFAEALGLYSCCAKVTTAAVNEAQRNWERAPPAERPPGMFVHKLEA